MGIEGLNMNTIGSVIKMHRKQQNLSQKGLCEGICSQSMMSAIESDKYTPNSQLLISLCKRLSLSLDSFNLSENFEISQQENFNSTVEELCNNHRYSELKKFLIQDQVVNSLKTDFQLQSYYYYLGISEFQIDDNLNNAIKNLKLSLTCAPESSELSTLSRLTLASLSLFSNSENQIQNAIKDINKLKYEQNQNIVYYLIALNYYRQKNYLTSFNYVQKAIDFITDHDSHYMLANSYYLLACIADKLSNDAEKNNALNRQELLTDLFKEKVFREI